jgi:hypothetical protein
MLGFDCHRPLQRAARLCLVVATGAVCLHPNAGRAQGFGGEYGGYGYPGPDRFYGGAPGYRYGGYGPGVAVGRFAGAYPPPYYVPQPYVLAPPVTYLPRPVYVGPPRLSYVVQGRAVRPVHRTPVHHVAARPCGCVAASGLRAVTPVAVAPAPRLVAPAPVTPAPSAPAATPTPRVPPHAAFPPDGFTPQPSIGD